MKILFDHQIFFLQKYGGISNYFFNLITQLNKKKISNKIYAPLYINEYIKNFDNKKLFGIKLNLNFFIINLFFNNLLYCSFLNKYKPDIVHLTYYQNNLSKFKFSYKYILTVYDMIHEEYSSNFKKDETSKSKFYSCDKADHIITISNNTKKKLIEYFKISPKKISVIHLGGDHMQKIKPKKINIKKKFILYVGNRLGYKNFENLVKAYNLNNKIKKNFDLIAFGGEKISNVELIKYKNKYNKIENIHFIKEDDAVLKFLYSRASLFVYPSLQEGFGIPPLEAIFNNCIVACSNIPVLKEVLGASCIYFDPKNIFKINNSLQKILYSKSIKKNLIHSSQKIKKKYTWNKCAIKTFDVYKKVLSKVAN